MENLSAFQMLEYAAWGLSALLGGWMLLDLVMTNSRYSEDVLLSSKEGDIEEEFVVDPTHRGQL
jgi:hypothetical protein